MIVLCLNKDVPPTVFLTLGFDLVSYVCLHVFIVLHRVQHFVVFKSEITADCVASHITRAPHLSQPAPAGPQEHNGAVVDIVHGNRAEARGLVDGSGPQGPPQGQRVLQVSGPTVQLLLLKLEYRMHGDVKYDILMSMALYDVSTHFIMQLKSVSGLDSNSAMQKPGSEGQGLFRP